MTAICFLWSIAVRKCGHSPHGNWLRPLLEEICLCILVRESKIIILTSTLCLYGTRVYVANNSELYCQNCLRYLANNLGIKLLTAQPRPLNHLRASLRPQTPYIFLFRKTLAQCYMLPVFLHLRPKHSSLSTSNHHHCQADPFADER